MSTGNDTRNQNMVAYFENIALGGGPGVGTVLTATAAELNIMHGVTVTAGQINAAGGGTLAPVLVPDAAAYTVLAADSGKTHIIPDLTASCTFTLPAGASGLNFHFIGNAVAADAQNWVFTAPAGVFYRGGVAFLDQDAGAGADEGSSVFPNGSSHITLTVNVPNAGTYVDFYWDGTRYVVNAFVLSNTAPAFS